MILIWSRWGILVVFFAILGVIIGSGLSAILGVTDTSLRMGVGGVGIVVSAALLAIFNRFVVGVYIDKPKALLIQQAIVDDAGNVTGHVPATATDPETGQLVMTKPVSSLFFIPLRFWPAILAVLGLIIAVFAFIVVSNR